MKTYFTIHTAPGMTQEQFQASQADYQPGEGIEVVRILVNFRPGKIVGVYRAESEEALIEELESAGWPHDGIFECHYEYDPAAFGGPSQ